MHTHAHACARKTSAVDVRVLRRGLAPAGGGGLGRSGAERLRDGGPERLLGEFERAAGGGAVAAAVVRQDGERDALRGGGVGWVGEGRGRGAPLRALEDGGRGGGGQGGGQ